MTGYVKHKKTVDSLPFLSPKSKISKLKNVNNILQLNLAMNQQSTGYPRKKVPLEEGRTSVKGTFFLGHLVGCLINIDVYLVFSSLSQIILAQVSKRINVIKKSRIQK